MPTSRRGFAALTGLLVVTTLTIGAMDRALVTPEVPWGIVSFEFASNAERSAEILRAWSGDATATAMFVQGFDFLYLFVYPAWFCVAVLGLGSSLAGRWAGWSRRIGWLALAAAPFDAGENIALVAQLQHGASDPLAQLAWVCALVKFALVGVAAGWLLAMSGVWVGRRIRGAP